MARGRGHRNERPRDRRGRFVSSRRGEAQNDEGSQLLPVDVRLVNDSRVEGLRNETALPIEPSNNATSCGEPNFRPIEAPLSPPNAPVHPVILDDDDPREFHLARSGEQYLRAFLQARQNIVLSHFFARGLTHYLLSQNNLPWYSRYILELLRLRPQYFHFSVSPAIEEVLAETIGQAKVRYVRQHCTWQLRKDMEHIGTYLSAIQVAELPEHENSCPICIDGYVHDLWNQHEVVGRKYMEYRQDASEPRESDIFSVALRLKCCGQHICEACLLEWMQQFENENCNLCPFCRAGLLPLHRGPEGIY